MTITASALSRRLFELEGGGSGRLHDQVMNWGDTLTIWHMAGEKYINQENMGAEQFAAYIARPGATPYKITLEIIDDIPKSIKKVENNVIIYEPGTCLENKNITYSGDQTFFLLPDNGRNPKI